MPSKVEVKKVFEKPVRKIIKKRRKKTKMYFGTPVQEAIIRYNASSNPAVKNRIYQEHIHKAFCKMAENLIHTFKFYYFDYPFEEVKNEVVSFLVMQMPKFQACKMHLQSKVLFKNQVDHPTENHLTYHVIGNKTSLRKYDKLLEG